MYTPADAWAKWTARLSISSHTNIARKHVLGVLFLVFLPVTMIYCACSELSSLHDFRYSSLGIKCENLKASRLDIHKILKEEKYQANRQGPGGTGSASDDVEPPTLDHTSSGGVHPNITSKSISTVPLKCCSERCRRRALFQIFLKEW